MKTIIRMKNYKVVLVDENDVERKRVENELPTIRIVYKNGNLRINTSSNDLINNNGINLRNDYE